MNTTTARSIRRVRGFTLLEVLIALMVFSLGMLGLAGMLVLSVKTNHSATQRTQATFLAQSLADRMRVNIIGVWNDNYNVALSSTPAAACNPTTAACTAAGMASWDLAAWFDQVQQALPAASANVLCVKRIVLLPTDLKVKPPYQGTCEIRLNWSESVLNGSRDATGNVNTTGQETFAWVFTP